MSASLERIVVEPKTPATAVVIWLHGLGDSGAGFAPVVPALGLPSHHSIRFIFPHAPEQAVTINGGYVMRAWYDIKAWIYMTEPICKGFWHQSYMLTH
ncbi:carboxylesterase [Shewanella putrefaciens]|nr:carboxylesterase [Shewanella putrefaciens]